MASNKNILAGYWPKELFPHMSDGSERVTWGGTTHAGKGHFPDGKYDHACYFAEIHYFDDQNATLPPADQDIVEHVDEPECYGLRNEKFNNQKNWGYSFTFGGPGGQCA